MPYQRIAAEILAQWREVERAMQEPGVGPEAMADLQAEADRLKAEYQGYIRMAINAQRPEPPPFPESPKNRESR